MNTYRIRLAGYNPWHPEYGSAEVVLFVQGFDPIDALFRMRDFTIDATETRVVCGRWGRPGLGHGAKGYPCWDILTYPRKVATRADDYVVGVTYPTRTIASIGR